MNKSRKIIKQDFKVDPIFSQTEIDRVNKKLNGGRGIVVAHVIVDLLRVNNIREAIAVAINDSDKIDSSKVLLKVVSDVLFGGLPRNKWKYMEEK